MTRLYAILEVDPTASPEEIRRAYRRLALQHHPDKAGTASAPKFQEINAAYSTLSDPHKREVYDRYGDHGLQYASTPFAEMALQGAGVRVMLLLFSTLSFIWLSLLLIFLSFLAVKIDGKVQWTWPQVMSPLFAIDGVVLLLLAVSVPQLLTTIRNACSSSADASTTETSQDALPTSIEMTPNKSTITSAAQIVLVYLESVLLVALTITVAVGLDSKDPGSLCWRAYLAPWYAWAGCYFVGALLTCRPPVTAERFARVGISGLSRRFLVAYGAAEALQGACSVVFSVVCACRIDGVITTNWFVVGIPIYVAMGAVQLRRVLESEALYTAAVERGEVEESRRGCVTVCNAVAHAVLSAGIPLTTFSIILSMLEGSGVKMAHALIPLFVAVGVMVISGCCLMCGSMCAPQELFTGSMPSATYQSENEAASDQQAAVGTPVAPLASP